MLGLGSDWVRKPRVCIVNIKLTALQVRHDPRYDDHVPVMVHVNYHPDKHPRMLAIVKRYVTGDAKALTPFPSGSE